MKHLLTTISLCVFGTVYAQPTDSALFFFNKGMEEKNAKRYLVASQHFNKAIQFNPSYTEALIENAYTCMEMRKSDQAKALFIKVNEISPTNKVAIKELMTLYFNYRQFEKAIEFANQCKECEEASRIIGMSRYQQEDYPAAESALKAALAKNPADAEATYTLARAYVDMEEYKKALPYYEKAVKMDGAKAMWMYEQGILLFNQSEYPKAMAAFQLAAQHGYVQSHDFMENLGYASLYSGEYDKGEKLLMDIWSKKPGNKDLLRGLAEVLYQQKQFDRSLLYCQKLMEIDANDGKALYQAGMCFQKKGEKDRGQQMCDKAIEMDPSLSSLRRKKWLGYSIR